MNRAGALILAVALVGFWPGSGAADVGGTWGVGFTANYELPVFKLNQWFPSGGPQFGATVVHVVNETWSAEVEAHYSKFGDGDLEGRAFLWSVDGRDYQSPQANSEMTWGSVVVNFIRHFGGSGKKLEQGGGAPYFLLGAGFFHYENNISGLIYPAQSQEPLDTSILLRPVSDIRTALGLNLGMGVEYFASRSMAIDLRAQYNLIMGTVRPLEAWGLEEVFPFQKLNFGGRLSQVFEVKPLVLV